MFKRNRFGALIRKADGAVIPLDIGNTDYRVYLDWVSEGNSPEVSEEITVEEQNAPHQEVIDREERKSLRAIREFLLGDQTALARLQAAEDVIKLKRTKLR